MIGLGFEILKAGPPFGRRYLNVTFLLSLLFYLSLPSSVQSLDEHQPQLPISPDKRLVLFRDCDGCPEMVVVPGGSFLMGSPGEEQGRHNDEGPRREVSIQPFALGRFEVTRGEFAQFVAATGHAGGPCVYWETSIGPIRQGYDLDLHNPGLRQRQTDRHPVTCVSFDDAEAYVDWLQQKTGKAYRLPSEAEWEYAARAGTSSRYFWGDDAGMACDHANGHDQISKQANGFNWAALPCHDDFSSTAPVGSFGANGFALFDMAGNLWEWVEDHYHGTYEEAPTDGRPWSSIGHSARVLRGGSWENEPRDLRSASRIWSRPGSRLNSSGFRVALTLSEF